VERMGGENRRRRQKGDHEVVWSSSGIQPGAASEEAKREKRAGGRLMEVKRWGLELFRQMSVAVRGEKFVR